MNHAYSTYALLITLFIGGVIVVNALLSEDVDELCSTNGSILRRIDGEWQCDNVKYATGYYHSYYSPMQVHFTAANTYTNITVYTNISGNNFEIYGNSIRILHEGKYLILSGMSFNGGNGGVYEIELHVNDVAMPNCAFFMTTSTVDILHGEFSCVLNLNVNDRLVIKAKDISAPVQDMWYYQLTASIIEVK